MANRLRNKFLSVKRSFFPRWDRNDEWRVRSVRDLHGACGKCFPHIKIIKVAIIPVDLTLECSEDDPLDCLLVHEIAHAAAWELSHTKKWLNRMAKAADKADQIDRPKLAALLRKQIASYTNANVPAGGVGTIYGDIVDVNRELPDLTFLQVIDIVRREYGLTRKDLLRYCRRAQNVYDREVARSRQIARLRERIALKPK